MTLPQPSQIPVARAEPAVNSRFVRRLETEAQTREDAASSFCIIVLAVIGLFALLMRRVEYDPWVVVGIELCLGAALIALITLSRRVRWPQLLITVLSTALILMPWLVNLFSRRFGNGNDAEILLLASLGWGSAALAISSTARAQNLSVACSGFLTLFTVFTSDSPEITLVVYLWMAVCLWWLVSRHWAGVSTLHAAKIQGSFAARIVTLAIGCGAFVLAILLISDSVPVLRKLRAEIAPTSGGTSQKDKAARSGVGNGDALIAAKNHATSFGAVETDFFLDSPKPSLFDVFSDEFGEPIRNKKVERAQALSPEDIRSDEGNFAEANRSSGGDFSIERDAPKLREPLEDLSSGALMFFEGRTGIRLAVQRYDSFEKNRWKNSKLVKRSENGGLQPITVDVDEDLWFAPPGRPTQSSLSPFASNIAEALRFTRYGDNSIPLALGMQMWRIDQLTRSDFFTYTSDNCLFMPGRETVPDYTVVRFINSQLDAEKLHQHMRTCAPGVPHLLAEDTCRSKIAQLAHRYGGEHERGLSQVQAIIGGLKRDFAIRRTEKRSEEIEQGALEHFLNDGTGPSYLFATAAALMLDHFGYQTRLVTGFYVDPEHYVHSENATAILPEDAHCWIEINSGHGYWVPLEPSPGFRTPPIRSTWLFWASRNWPNVAIGLAAAAAVIVTLYVLRGSIFNAALFVSAPLFRLLPQNSRLASFRALLDVRWSLIGAKRPASVTPRKRLANGQWGLNDTQREVAMQFFDVYEAQRFGVTGAGTLPSRLDAMPAIIRSVKRR